MFRCVDFGASVATRCRFFDHKNCNWFSHRTFDHRESDSTSKIVQRNCPVFGKSSDRNSLLSAPQDLAARLPETIWIISESFVSRMQDLQLCMMNTSLSQMWLLLAKFYIGAEWFIAIDFSGPPMRKDSTCLAVFFKFRMSRRCHGRRLRVAVPNLVGWITDSPIPNSKIMSPRKLPDAESVREKALPMINWNVVNYFPQQEFGTNIIWHNESAQTNRNYCKSCRLGISLFATEKASMRHADDDDSAKMEETAELPNPILLTDCCSLFSIILRMQPNAQERRSGVILAHFRDIQSLLSIGFIDATVNLIDVGTKHGGNNTILHKFTPAGRFGISSVGRKARE